MADLRTYLTSLSTTVEDRDGVAAADHLSIQDAHADSKRLIQQISTSQVNELVVHPIISVGSECVMTVFKEIQTG